MNKLNCDTSEYTNPLGGKVKALEKETTGLKTSLAIVTDTVSQLIADKAASASLAQKVIDSAEMKTEKERRLEHEISKETSDYLSVAIY